MMLKDLHCELIDTVRHAMGDPLGSILGDTVGFLLGDTVGFASDETLGPVHTVTYILGDAACGIPIALTQMAG